MDYRRNALSETILTVIVVILIMVTVWSLLSDGPYTEIYSIISLSGLALTAFAIIRLSLSPDKVRASQTGRILKLASKSMEHMRSGLNRITAQEVCELLLPETQAHGIAIMNTERYLGYAADMDASHMIGHPICTQEAFRALKSKELIEVDRPFLLKKLSDTVGLDIQAAIFVPLVVRDTSVGMMGFYYDAPHFIDETQRAIAHGLADLLSTQLSTSELDRQAELATRAELRALQSQINPHFLFNTINTIAALIRTNPNRARILLREFAVFYRQTLENSESLISLERELQQTMRYLGFEIARFGEERIKLELNVDDDLLVTQVPSFIIQPIIENAVNHAMRSEGELILTIKVYRDDEDVLICVSDNGVGMDAETLSKLDSSGPTEKGTGIALKNVRSRLAGYFDSDSSLEVDSELDKGTTVTMRLGGAALRLLEKGALDA